MKNIFFCNFNLQSANYLHFLQAFLVAFLATFFTGFFATFFAGFFAFFAGMESVVKN